MILNFLPPPPPSRRKTKNSIIVFILKILFLFCSWWRRISFHHDWRYMSKNSQILIFIQMHLINLKFFPFYSCQILLLSFHAQYITFNFWSRIQRMYLGMLFDFFFYYYYKVYLRHNDFAFKFIETFCSCCHISKSKKETRRRQAWSHQGNVKNKISKWGKLGYLFKQKKCARFSLCNFL